MAALLALCSALLFGIGDFAGGIAARRARVVSALLVAQSIGTLLLLVVGIVGSATAQWTPTAHDMHIGLVAGVLGAVAVVSFSVALAAGPMSVIAPVTALVAAVVPVGVGLAQGERPSAVASIGVVLALLAIWMVSRDDSAGEPVRQGPVLLAVLAGSSFGAYYSVLHASSKGSGTWSVFWEHLGVVLCLAAVAVVRRDDRSAIRPSALAPAWAPILVNGVFDALANAFYVVAAHRGMLSVVAVLSALYPTSTVLLARVLLHERPSRVQHLGLGAAAAAVALVALG